jgi:hypothetical protein
LLSAIASGDLLREVVTATRRLHFAYNAVGQIIRRMSLDT